MQSRLEAQKTSPAAYNAMLGLEMFIRKSSKLEPSLVELVKMRASQIQAGPSTALRSAQDDKFLLVPDWR